MTDRNPRWDPDTRWEIQRVMNALLREAADLTTRRSEGGQWLPPGDIAETGDNAGMVTAARVWVLDRLEQRMGEAREVLDRVEAECRAHSGIRSAPKPSGDAQQ